MPANRHKISYEVLNRHEALHYPPEFEVHATPEELQDFAASGYLIREQLFQGKALSRLQEATDRLDDAEGDRHRKHRPKDRSWGIILRHLMDKDPVFLELLKYPPVLSVCRAMMGPLVRLRGLTARISFPGAEVQETNWHQHMRVVSKPLPPWFSQPHAIDALIYLDDINDDTGPVCVVPGSHTWLDRHPDHQIFASIEGEKVLRVPAGSVVMIHGNLWHRAMPTLRKKRRMLILGYTPTWLRKSPHGGPPPADGLTAELLQDCDEETKELLGIGGYS
ncbi:MAG TPA: hypothetical protein EYG11_05965 [Candidatus Latescibacteria bacterium]|nr:hypothetical protein [Candidatus Handelsmanbacteria bacterium]HIL08229.1 hypothetical protein [Candidatus Latescibacterota bacterium]